MNNLIRILWIQILAVATMLRVNEIEGSPALRVKAIEETDYAKVLELSLLFYEAQRSGKLPSDNRIPWRSDSALGDRGLNGEDLTGGYYDGNAFILFTIYSKNAGCVWGVTGNPFFFNGRYFVK